MQPSRFFALSIVALLMLVWPLVADGGDRRWITNERGETVGYLEPAPLSDSRLVIRDRDGQAVGVIERKELGDGYVIQDRNSDRLGQLEGQQDRGSERGYRRDWRDGPAVEWGFFDERW